MRLPYSLDVLALPKANEEAIMAQECLFLLLFIHTTLHIDIWEKAWEGEVLYATLLCRSATHGCQMAIAKFLDCTRLALRASGL